MPDHGFNPELIVHRLGELEEWRREMVSIVRGQQDAQSTIQTLVRERTVAERELRGAIERCFTTLEKVDGRVERVSNRVQVVEEGLPMLRMTSRWVIGGVLALVTGTAGIGALLVLVLRAMIFHNQVTP